MGDGKIKRVYRRCATPWELLQEVSDLDDYLKSGLTLNHTPEGAQPLTTFNAILQSHSR